MGAIQQMLAAVGSSGAAPWTPANLSTAPYIWYAPESAVTDAGSGACSQWDDYSGNARHLTQGTNADRPLIVSAGLNGYRVLRGDGSSDNMATGARAIFRNASAGYCFFVWQRVVSTGGGVARVLFLSRNNSTGSRFLMQCDSVANPNKLTMQVRRLDGDSAASLVGATSVNVGWHMGLAIMDWANGDGFLYVDGALDASNTSLTTSGNTSDTPAAADPLFLSSTSAAYADAEVPEWFAGPYLPNSTEIDKIFGYAAHKYGLTANLPALHPYKSAAPTV